MRLFWICLGGAVGTGARYLVSGWVLRVLGVGFSYGTLVVNLAGSFLLGALMHLGLTTQSLPVHLRLALTTGVMGGFTTYSTFNYETLGYLEQGRLLLGLGNVLATVAACLAAGAAGMATGRALAGS